MKDIRKFLRTYQPLISAFALFLFVIAGFAIGIIPTVYKVLTLRTEAEKLTTQIQELRSKAGILEAIDEDTYQKYVRDLIVAVPADQSLTSVFSTIDGLASQTGITVTDMELEDSGSIASESGRKQSLEEKQVGTNLLPFAVTIAGNYDQIQAFLEKAVNVRRFFQVRGFGLSLVDPTNVSVRMTMDAFYAPLVSAIGGIDTMIEPLNERDEQIITAVALLPIMTDQSLESGAAEALAVPAVPRADPFSP